MKKSFRKALALLLSFMISVTCFAVAPFSALAEAKVDVNDDKANVWSLYDVSAEFGEATSHTYFDDVKDDNILSKTGATGKLDVFNTTTGQYGPADAAGNGAETSLRNILWDGGVEEPDSPGGTGARWRVYSSQPTRATFDFGRAYDFTKIYFSVVKGYAIPSYEIYISDDAATLYDAENKIISYSYTGGRTTATGDNVDSYTFTGETKPNGRYIGIAGSASNNTMYTEIGFEVVKVKEFEPAGFDKSDLVDVNVITSPCVAGKPYQFSLKTFSGAKITSVKYDEEELTPESDVYTITDTNTEPKNVVITTDKDDAAPKNGQWNGIDLTTRKSAAGNALWNNAVSVHETAFFYDALGKERHEISLLYPIDDVISLRSYDLKTVYHEGEDFVITADGKIKLTENTTIPIYGDDPSETDDIRCVTGSPGAYSTDWNGEGRWCNRTWQYQIDITYTHTKTWGKNAMYEKGVENQSAALKKFYDKAASGEDTHVLFLGDSITEGLLATACDIQAYTYKSSDQILGPSDVTSRYTRANHFSSKFTLDEIKEWGGDSFATQVGEALTAKLGSNVTYVNRGVGATNTQWTWNNIKFLAGPADPTCNPVGTPTPDLAFIAFGTNESGNGYSYTKTKFTDMINYLRTRNPDCCVVLVSAFYANRYDSNGKLVCYSGGLGEQERAAKDLASELDGVVYAPVWSMFKSMIDDEADGTNYNGTKQVFDYMGDMCNHPNDFGHTVYASTILSAMGLDEVAAKPQAVETTANSITLDSSTPLLYKMDDGKWQTTGKFEGLENNTEYTFYAASPTALMSEKAVIKTSHEHDYSDEWSSDETQHWHQCKYCTEKIDVADHDTEVVGAVAAKCEEDGYTGDTVCKICKKTVKAGEVIPAKGHDFGEYVETKPATCEEPGEKTGTCKNCPKTETVAIPAKGHKTTLVGKKAATCSAAGYTGDEKCTVCQKIVKKGSTIAKKAHTYVTVTTKKATYFAKGQKQTKCKVCGSIKSTTPIAQLKLKTPKVKVTAAKKALKIKVTKVTGQTGFKIRYRIKGKSKWTIKTFTSKKTATKTIKKLKGKKNYQIGVCAIVKSGKNTASSKWSKTYTKKTK